MIPAAGVAVVPVPVIDINVDETVYVPLGTAVVVPVTVYVPVGVAVTVPDTGCVPEFATV